MQQIQDVTAGFGVDYAIDAAGGPKILEQAFAATIAGGTIVCVGIPGPGSRPSLPGPELVRDEKIVTGSLYGSSRPGLDIPAILRQYMAGRLPLDRMITKTYELGGINSAFDDMHAGLLKRGVVVFDSDLAGVSVH